MTDPSEPEHEPANLRFLRRLVTVLTAVMIGGLLVIVALLVIRFSARAPILPPEITLPDGAKAEAITSGPGWYGVVTKDDRFLVYDAETGQLRQTVRIETSAPTN